MATLRQKKAIGNVLENHGRSVSQAMRDAGYDETTAKNPKNLTESKAWQELVEDNLPDTLLFERHKELLNKRDVVKTFSHETGETEVTVTDQPETQAVSKALDMAYKIKRKYPQGPSAIAAVQINISSVLDELENE